jgi:glycosyltransferase involved in cell wall biosynthesis
VSGTPTITLVTPSFQQAGFIEETIGSVVAQDCAGLDWWIVDALSDDGTGEILDRWEGTLGLTILRERDAGQGDAIAKGFARGSGEVLGWLNSDDVLLPGALRVVGDAFAANPDAVAVCGSGWKVDAEGRRTKRVAAREFDGRLIRTALTYLQPAMFFRRDAYEAVGGLDTSLRYAMDWDLLMRLAERGRVVAVDVDLAELRCYAATKSEAGGWERLREIAELGRRANGARDRNWVAYRLRRVARGSDLGRRAVDWLLAKIYASRTVMVTGWPRINEKC